MPTRRALTLLAMTEEANDPLKEPPSLDFEGRRIPVYPGDTVASALFRSGVRTFTRSIKYHRRRGLYCLSGDCPNCLVNVDGGPAFGPALRRRARPTREWLALCRACHLRARLLDVCAGLGMTEEQTASLAEPLEPVA
jgi:hypothetical protein